MYLDRSQFIEDQQRQKGRGTTGIFRTLYLLDETKFEVRQSRRTTSHVAELLWRPRIISDFQLYVFRT